MSESVQQAWAWQGDASPLALRLAEMPIVRPGPGDALVRNVAVGLNPVDWKLLAHSPPDWVPGHVPGVDGAGHVVAVGAGVPSEWIGRRVAYHQDLRRAGSFAELTCVPARALMHLPEHVTFEVAASLPCPGLTAWQALDKLPLRPGMRLLVSGAGGAVGRFLVQLAHARGVRVTAMAHPRHTPRLMALGVEAFLPGPLPDGETFMPDDGGFDVVIDSTGGDHAARLASALRANGHLLGIQGRPAGWPDAPFTRAISLHEVALGALHRFGDDEAWRGLTAAGEAMLNDLAEGKLLPEALVTHDFIELPAVLEGLRGRNFSGKALLRLPG
ncbi:alcohol dehydrogenase catalytic domain-containing protein [Xanthobacter agilis]|uniref:alcohol dehydrogenase catalytic domain-containing protein n=1 Tax=Xanthobacter agilis TaxID=47492 RepID=UPI00372818E9